MKKQHNTFIFFFINTVKEMFLEEIIKKKYKEIKIKIYHSQNY